MTVCDECGIESVVHPHEHDMVGDTSPSRIELFCRDCCDLVAYPVCTSRTLRPANDAAEDVQRRPLTPGGRREGESRAGAIGIVRRRGRGL